MAAEQASQDAHGENNELGLKTRLDQELDDLIKNVLPTAPYLLRMSYQSDNPQPKDLGQRYWAKSTPFAPEEEALQYVTFHQTPFGLLRAVGQWDDGNGSLAPAEPAQSQSSSGRTSLQTQAAKKKLTMEEYRKNKNNPAAKDDSSKPLAEEVNGSQEKATTVKADQEGEAKKKEELQKKQSDAHVVAKPASVGSTDDVIGAKRKRSESPKPNNYPLSQDDDLKIPSAKKYRSEVSPNTKEKDQERSREIKPLPSERNEPQLNGRPELEGEQVKTKPPHATPKATAKSDRAPLSQSRSSTLPKLVSPTLPGALNFTMPPLLSPTLPTEVEEMLADIQSRRPKGLQKSASGSRSARTGSSSQPPEKRAKSETESKASDRTGKEDEAQNRSSEKRSKWITLRMSRAKLARLARASTKVPNGSHGSVGPKREASTVQRPPSRSSALDKMRSVDNLRKPVKAINGSRTPATPTAMDSSPPGPGTPGSRDTRSAAGPTSSSMLRGGSGQGVNATSLAGTRNATPSSPVKPELRAEYQAESDRLSRLGRDLKHESDAYLKREAPSSADTQRGLILASESCLTFMLAAVVLDEPARREGQPGHRSIRWQTVLPFLWYIKGVAEPFPHLQGLLFQLEAVIRDTVEYHLSYKLQSFMRESGAPNESQQKTLRDFMDNVSRARKAWRHGNALLWIHDLMKSFPNTWAKARPEPSRGKGSDGVKLGDFAADGFALPMTVSTTGIEAVNAGLSILTEYCKKEKIDWKAKLKL